MSNQEPGARPVCASVDVSRWEGEIPAESLNSHNQNGVRAGRRRALYFAGVRNGGIRLAAGYGTGAKINARCGLEWTMRRSQAPGTRQLAAYLWPLQCVVFFQVAEDRPVLLNTREGNCP